MSAPDFSDDVGRVSVELMQMSSELLRLWCSPSGTVPSGQQLRQIVAKAITDGRPLQDVMRENETGGAQAQPYHHNAEIETSGPIAEHALLVEAIRQLVDHAASGGCYRRRHKLVWEVVRALRIEPPSLHRPVTSHEKDAVHAAIDRGLSLGIIRAERGGVAVTPDGAQWLAGCDRRWLECRT